MVTSNQNPDEDSEPGILGQLKAYKDQGTAKGLMVLDEKNDPFWVSNSRERDAKWIAGIWEKYHETRGWPGRSTNEPAHDRGIHYFILSLVLECPWGQKRRVHPSELYMNVKSDWGNLCRSIRDARNWGLIPWDAIVNRQSVGLERWTNYGKAGKQDMPFENFDGKVDHYLEVEIPEIEEIEEATIWEESFDEEVESLIDKLFRDHTESLISAKYQPYYVCVVSEKQGLRGVARKTLTNLNHGFDFLNYEGHATTTVIRNFATRILGGGPPEHAIKQKKIRIFYLADFDYAGRIMVPAFAWKLYYLLLTMGDPKLDIKIKPLALTKEQVKEYDLPPAPVASKSLGQKTLQDRWLREFGKVIEIDALMTLHPGELERIIEDAIHPYVDWDLESELKTNMDEWREEVSEGITEDLESKREAWDDAHKKLTEAVDELNTAMDDAGIINTLRDLTATIDGIRDRYDIDDLIETYKDTLKGIEIEAAHYADKFTTPESNHDVDEPDDWLYDNSRHAYLNAQILRDYKP